MKITIKIEDPDRGEGYSIKRGVESDLSLDGLRDAAEKRIEELERALQQTSDCLRGTCDHTGGGVECYEVHTATVRPLLPKLFAKKEPPDA